MQSNREAQFETILRLYGLFENKSPLLRVEPEYHFAKSIGRRLRYDFAWPELKVAVEIQGGTWSKNKKGHNRSSKIEKDCEKQNVSALLGWRVLYVTSKMLDRDPGTIIDILTNILQSEVDEREKRND